MFFKPRKTENDFEEEEDPDGEVVTEQEGNQYLNDSVKFFEEEPQVPDDTFLNLLFSFLDLEGKLNPTSAGYFCKVVDSLLTKCSDDVRKWLKTPENNELVSLAYHISLRQKTRTSH